jgi:hypothetical protein
MGGEENEITRQTHHCSLPFGISKQEMAAASYDSPCTLREGDDRVTGYGNPIVDLLSMGSDAGKENEMTRCMHLACMIMEICWISLLPFVWLW